MRNTRSAARPKKQRSVSLLRVGVAYQCMISRNHSLPLDEIACGISSDIRLDRHQKAWFLLAAPSAHQCMISRNHSPARFTISPRPLSCEPQPGFIGICVPTGTAIGTASVEHPASTCRPLGKSIHVSASASGMGAFQDVVPRLAIRRDHTGSAPEDPVNPVGRLSSYPTHTTTT